MASPSPPCTAVLPHEIEAICRYMLEEKGLNTFVKLNPPLLGYARVREILDVCGFGYIGLKKSH
ncbi:pyridine nucleotide-disulfide oxidoreductase [Escherichia coli]|uniref:Pyridine nucleotide-disulfide oxidoreductase n=1 Tax=Escherichia coli TaxID=562 RepID=A0A2X1N771_ECOLX|nr:pyridine nucleotide-disulfide oxidoreductase [Escherichia coli]